MGNERLFSQREIEAAFIKGHWEYGSLIHQNAADALVAALSNASEPATGHALFSRLFGEYAGSLETYAAWGWSLRNRTKPGSFLDNYLGYTNQQVGDYYRLVQEHQGDLSDLLRLPSVDTLVEVGTTRLREAGITDLKPKGFATSVEAQYARMKEAADRYFATDRIVVDAYNKTKHGAPMLQLFNPDNPRAFEFVVRNPHRDGEGEPPYRFPSFTVDRVEVEKMASNVSAMTGSIQDLASLTKVLFDAGVLYDV